MNILSLALLSSLLIPGSPIEPVRIKFDSESAPYSQLVGYNSTSGEWVVPDFGQGIYTGHLYLQYNEVADGGSQATSAAVLQFCNGAWGRQDVQLPEGFVHIFAGDSKGFCQPGDKVHVDFTNATGKNITLTAAHLFIALDGLM